MGSGSVRFRVGRAVGLAFLAVLLGLCTLFLAGTPSDWEDVLGRGEPTFYEVARKHLTDKVKPHQYHRMYQKYIGPIRNNPLKILEIGLGCMMGYGGGASLRTWLEFVPNAHLHYIEYDPACADSWKANTSTVKIFTGDQADKKFLHFVLNETGGQFDIIVDDGGHTMEQQITSFEYLFPGVRPGGYYFCEDLHTSYEISYGGGVPAANKTMMSYIQDLLNDLNVFRTPHHNLNRSHPISIDIMSVDCMEEICAFVKFKEMDKRPGWQGDI